LDLFAPTLAAKLSMIYLPIDAPKSPHPLRKRRVKEFRGRGNHGCSAVEAMVRGKPKTTCLFIFLCLVVKDAPFQA